MGACSGLTGIAIPTGVSSICDCTFSYCTGLKSITVPDSVANIGNDAFIDCDGLQQVHIADLSAWCKYNLKGLFPIH